MGKNYLHPRFELSQQELANKRFDPFPLLIKGAFPQPARSIALFLGSQK
jgi:hypothetical protein